MGGISSERAVSLQTGEGVQKALTDLGYDTVPLDWHSETNPAKLVHESGVDVIWNALHGTLGEDGAVQGLLDCLGVPYTGSGVLASALAMDKIASKRLYDALGIPTPPWLVVQSASEVKDALARFGLPLVIKPGQEGSSVGVSVVSEKENLAQGFLEASKHGGPVLVERYIPGAELHIGVLDGRILGSIEVRPASGFYDYEAKYERDDTQYIIPPGVPGEHVRAAEAVALTAYEATGCAGHGRVDIRVGDGGHPYVLEVNTLPGMTSHSLLPKIAIHGGMSYGHLCETILDCASRRVTNLVP